MKNDALRQFVEKVSNSSAPLISPRGPMSSSSDVTEELQRNTFSFAEAYEDTRSSRETVQQLANLVEGSLMTEEVLSVISDKEAVLLIDELHDLLKSRASTAEPS
jgi:rRNA pseudouridine-1189 N-methylase Emg1 (Nep1/Mra1 family)